MDTPKKKMRGFAVMNKAKVKAIASKGGKAVHKLGKGHEWNRETARIAGKKGGLKVSADRTHMAKIGKLGGMSKAKNWRENYGNN